MELKGKVIGLTGGIGSGKSTILRTFKKLGAKVIDADKLGREVVLPGKPASLDIKKLFGKEVFFNNGRLNRKKLARKVFGDKKALAKLTDIIHPRVFEEEKKLIKKYCRSKNSVVVVDAPMMIESNSHKWKDFLIVINISRENQIKRVLKKGILKKAEIEKRIDNQMPLSKKLKYADYVIDNNGSLAECRKNAEEIYKKIVKLP